MKKTYQIEVDCANCANLMEEAAGKTEGRFLRQNSNSPPSRRSSL